MGYSFQLAARVFYMHHTTDRIAYTMAFDASHGALAGMRMFDIKIIVLTHYIGARNIFLKSN